MNKLTFLSFIGALFLTSGVAQADHNDPHGSVGLLHYETERLEQVVNYSNLNYNVKRSVVDFSSAVHRLDDCVSFGERLIFHDHTDQVGCPQQCAGQLHYAQSVFAQVSRYLRDTQWDYPQVFSQWQRTYQVLNAIHVSGPGPGPGNYRCTAVDRAFENHGAGHQGFGRTVNEAERSAIGACRRYHSYCVIYSCN